MADGLVFFGTEQFSVPSLRRLIETGTPVSLVVTKPDTPRGRGRALTPPAVKELALEHGIPVSQPATRAELVKVCTEQPATFGVLVAYGRIVPQEVLDHFSDGIINVHASLLPRWRGASPIERAILHGDAKTGVSLMRLVAEMDAGPVYGYAELPLMGTETKPDLYERLSELGAETLAALLPHILSGDCLPLEQDETGVTLAPLIAKQDGEIDWSEPAEHIERHVRAFLGWPGSRTELFGRRVTVTAAEAMTGGEASDKPYITSNKELVVPCGKGFLRILRLKPEGGREMAAEDFINGLKTN